MDRVRAFINQPLKHHLIIATFIRLALICYGNYHDKNFDVPYTDVDYKVFSDAGRHVFNGNSPYKRHTYRYSPVIAYLMVPNLFWKEFGKVLFCVFDVLITIAVKTLVEHQLGKTKNSKSIAMYCSLFWLYNPMSIAISTRGNADSVPCFFIVLSLLFLQTDAVKSSIKYAISGILLGISIHLRMYPLAFSFPMYLSLGRFEKGRVTFKDVLYYIVIPNKKQLLLALSCVTTLVTLTCYMYFLYGYEFLFETYLYHLFRKDTKHNFSVLFYYSYLTMDQLSFDSLKAVTQFLEFIILFVLSLTFGCDPKTLPFGLFCQTVVLVAYNSVMTSQYFIWFLSLLPLVVHSFDMDVVDAVVWSVMWMLPQAAWLYYAYSLEFQCREVFIFVWLKSIVFFCGNIYILCQLIKSYSPGYGFGMINPAQTAGKAVKQS
ncbi:GPI mannosyltransferase [Operophtera brumata]|uniref:GPI alpha-1,4-mannosyltransferase I, catalytic subunit n=1 Tax=Operophtera brumata TaxID=104452 RepID=A0A0L7LJ24_OPEBR|nr:GPI mannosyltransferase [Operophtera brumata]